MKRPFPKSFMAESANGEGKILAFTVVPAYF